MPRNFHLHLVSDATGETVIAVARAAVSQFEDVEVVEHLWSLVRTQAQLKRVFLSVEANPGVVMFTLVNKQMRTALQEGCRALQVPCIPVLDPVISTLSSYLGVASRDQPGRQHLLDGEYFERIDAMNFALNHDDGQAAADLEHADIVLVGVSRTAKTPTCFYLANRGLKAANVPIVPGCPLPPEMEELGRPLIVGLTRNPDQLMQIRRNRLHLLQQDEQTEYVDPERVRDEVTVARRMFAKRGWPVIDVTRRSIEETAAAILQLHTRRLEG